MRKIFFILLSVVFLINNLYSKENQTKPNIVLINIDDLGWSDVHFQGNPFYETPNIDKLAVEGMVFDNGYASAANCAPSRAALMTGQYSPRHGVYTVATSARGKSKDRKIIPIKNTFFIKKNNLTIANVLQSHGYKTISLGKWHVSSDPTLHGFDTNVGGSVWGQPPGTVWGHRRKGYFSPYKNKYLEDGPKGEYLTDRLTQETINFIKNNKTSPFFVYLAYYSIHTPIQAKQKTIQKYKKKKKTKLKENSAYAAMIENMDENIGKLMTFLDQQNLSKNTLVIFTSDNGAVYKLSKSCSLRAGKGSYYEGGIKVPLIARWTGKIKAGSKCNEPVINIDFFPTFLEIANIKKPKNKILDGVSIYPLLQQKEIKPRSLFWHFPIYLEGGNRESKDKKFRTRPVSVIRSGKWKMHQYFEDNFFELYNLEEDSLERINLVEQNQFKNQLEEMKKKLFAWQKKINAPISFERNNEYQKR